MTYGDLRRVLTRITNQDLTVKELREILFTEREQDKEINPDKITFWVNGKLV